MFGTAKTLRSARMGGIHGNGTLHSGPLAGSFFPEADEHPWKTTLFWLGLGGIVVWGSTKLLGDPVNRAEAKRIKTEAIEDAKQQAAMVEEIANSMPG
jgi:hypothetical protein